MASPNNEEDWEGGKIESSSMTKGRENAFWWKHSSCGMLIFPSWIKQTYSWETTEHPLQVWTHLTELIAWLRQRLRVHPLCGQNSRESGEKGDWLSSTNAFNLNQRTGEERLQECYSRKMVHLQIWSFFLLQPPRPSCLSNPVEHKSDGITSLHNASISLRVKGKVS